jgi:hypothetical protein
MAGALSASAAMADVAPFLGTDPAAVAAKGEIDVQQWFSWAAGHTGVSYNGFQSQTEFDYGLTDRLQLALTLVYDWSRTRPPGGPADANSLPGLAAEAIYIALPIDTNPIGLAFAVDPAFNAKSRGIAFRVLLTKYFAGFENVLNINFDNDWEKDVTGQWTGCSGITFNYGIAHALNHHWSVALELGNEFAFDELFTDGHLHAEANTFFFGPTLQYESALVTVTMGVQAQLPWSNGSTATHGYTPDVERFRVGLRFNRAI